MRKFQAGAEAYFEVADDTDPFRSSTKVVRAKVLIGADGMWSQVRKIMVGDDARDLRLIYWNALVPVDQIRSHLRLNLTSFLACNIARLNILSAVKAPSATDEINCLISRSQQDFRFSFEHFRQ